MIGNSFAALSLAALASSVSLNSWKKVSVPFFDSYQPKKHKANKAVKKSRRAQRAARRLNRSKP